MENTQPLAIDEAVGAKRAGTVKQAVGAISLEWRALDGDLHFPRRFELPSKDRVVVQPEAQAVTVLQVVGMAEERVPAPPPALRRRNVTSQPSLPREPWRTRASQRQVHCLSSSSAIMRLGRANRWETTVGQHLPEF